MKLSLEEKTQLITLSEEASELLVEVISESLPQIKTPTSCDVRFKEVLSEIKEICPLLFDSSVNMYNYIQEQKISAGDSYFKRLKKLED